MKGGRVHLALLDAAGERLLWREIDGGLALPCVELEAVWAFELREAGEAFAALGLHATFLRTPLRLDPDDDDRVDLLQLAEAAAPPPPGFDWGPLSPEEDDEAALKGGVRGGECAVQNGVRADPCPRYRRRVSPGASQGVVGGV